MADHKGPVTSVRFALDDTRLLSCGSDKTLKFRTLDGSNPVVAHSCSSTIFDMDIDVTHKYAIAASKDRRLHVWSVAQAKPVRSYKLGNVGEPYKVQLDPAGIFVATSGDDRYLRLFDFFSGECLCRVPGHGELVTQIRFMHDCKRLVTTSGDGCIMVWKLSSKLTKLILQRRAELAAQGARPVTAPPAGGRPAKPANPAPQKVQRPETAIVGGREGFASRNPTTEDDAVVRKPSPENSLDETKPAPLTASLLPAPEPIASSSPTLHLH